MSEPKAGKIGLHISGMRRFGGVAPPKEDIEITLLIKGETVHQGTIKVPVEGEKATRHRGFAAEYQMVEVGRSCVLEVKASADKKAVRKKIRPAQGPWIHVSYNVYPKDHPDARKAGVSIETYQQPQRFR